MFRMTPVVVVSPSGVYAEPRTGSITATLRNQFPCTKPLIVQINENRFASVDCED